MAREEVELVGTAETGDLEQSLDRVAAKADRAGRAFKNADKEGAAKLKGGIEGVKKSAEAIQGPLGGMTSRVIAAGEAAVQFAGALGPVAPALIAVAGAALGTAGTVAAMYKLADAGLVASKSLDELREAGVKIPKLNEDLAGSLRQVDASSQLLDTQINRLKERIGAQFAPAVSLMNTLLAIAASEMTNLIGLVPDVTDVFGGALKNIQKFNFALAKFAGIAEQMGTGAGVQSIKDLRQHMFETFNANQQKNVLQTGEAIKKGAKKAEDANRKWLASLKESFREFEKQEREKEKALRTLDRWSEQWAAIANDLGAGIAVLREANEELRIMEVLAGVVADKFVNFSAVAAPGIDALNTTIGAFAQGTQRDLAAVEAEIAELEQRDDEHAKARRTKRQREAALLRTEAMNQWRLQQGLQIAQASAAAFTAASLALANPPGPPATVPVAAAALAAGLANVAQIVATKPQFHMGGQVGTGGAPAPDEVDIRARRNETVMTRQQMRNLGASRPLRATFRLKHRVMDEVQADNLNTPGSRSATAAARGSRSGHWRRRG